MSPEFALSHALKIQLIIRTERFYNTVPGCSADAAKEGEGHADDQGARTGNYQEYQGAVEP